MTNDKRNLMDGSFTANAGLVAGDIQSSDGARRFLADVFANDLKRHDFGDYIAEGLAADFACALAQHLALRRPDGTSDVQEMAAALERIAAGALADYDGVESDALRVLRCAKLLRELSAKRWRPISSAPRDGTRVDLWLVNHKNEGRRVTDAYWNEKGRTRTWRDGTWTEVDAPCWYAFARGYDYEDEESSCETPRVFVDHPRVMSWVFNVATHWMPRPDPPNNEDGRGETNVNDHMPREGAK
ncbi:TPA: hypothetical protein QDZ62_000123 [Stenotrophomonas maltophilia]|nr:hypothetical protein [Stenotrophomonas maltophilia]